jgi:CubicO group peptidase (beta-lactamase class C family)
VAVCLSVLTTPVVGIAHAAATAHRQEVTASGDDLAPSDLAAFVDGTMAAGMRDHHVPGAVVVVRGEETLLAKGYGTADVDAYLPFEISATDEDPVTLERLGTHTAGFEEQAVGIYAASPGDRLPPALAALAFVWQLHHWRPLVGP